VSETIKLAKKVFNAIRSNRKVFAGTSILAVLLLLATLGAAIYKARFARDPTIPGTFYPSLYPSPEHPLGTDHYGRDILAMALVGLGNSLAVGMIGGFFATLIAVVIGFAAGYKGGLLDHVLRSFTDTLLVIPTWPIFATLAAYVTIRSMPVFGLLVAAFSWPGAARAIRSQVLSLKNREFVQLAIITNLKTYEIIFFELLPNLLPYIVVSFSYATMGSIMAETALRFLGLGPPDVPTLGYLINIYIPMGYLSLIPFTMAFILILLAAIFVAFNLINIGLDEYFNPRLKKITGM
jgi:peptide/nickel transport system permease protein